MFWQITFTFFQLLVLVQSVLCKLSSPSTQWSDDTSHNPSLKLTWHVTFDYTHPSTSDLSLSNFALCGNGSPCLLLPRSPTKVLEEEREASRTAQVCALIAFDVSTFTLNKMCFLYNLIKIISSEDALEKSPWLLWQCFLGRLGHNCNQLVKAESFDLLLLLLHFWRTLGTMTLGAAAIKANVITTQIRCKYKKNKSLVRSNYC